MAEISYDEQLLVMDEYNKSAHYTSSKIINQTRTTLQTLVLSVAITHYSHLHKHENETLFGFILIVIIILFSKVEIYLGKLESRYPRLKRAWRLLSYFSALVQIASAYILGKIISDRITPHIITDNWNNVELIKPIFTVIIVLIIVVLFEDLETSPHIQKTIHNNNNNSTEKK